MLDMPFETHLAITCFLGALIILCVLALKG